MVFGLSIAAWLGYYDENGKFLGFYIWRSATGRKLKK